MGLIETGAAGRFEGSRLIDEHNGTDRVMLRWNGSGSDSNGSVRVVNERFENGITGEALLMHPKWVSNGSIKAWFPWARLPNNPVFKAKVGFLDSATGTDGVRFQVWEHHNHGGREIWNRIINFKKEFDGHLKDIEADLSHLSGQNVGIELRVDAGNSSGRDHAIFINPRVEQRGLDDIRTYKWVISPISLTVHNRNETTRLKGRGDEPSLVAVYFRSIFGRHGSTKVHVMDSVLQLGENIRAGRTVNIPDGANLKVHDTGITITQNVQAVVTSLQVMGCVFAAVELDHFGTSTVRKRIREKADKLNIALIEHIEGNAIPIPPPENFFRDILNRIEQDVNGSAGGGRNGLIGRLTSNIGHDLIGQNQLILVGASDQILRDGFGEDYRPESTSNPMSALQEGNFRLDFVGEGAHYSIVVQVRRSTEGILVR